MAKIEYNEGEVIDLLFIIYSFRDDKRNLQIEWIGFTSRCHKNLSFVIA